MTINDEWEQADLDNKAKKEEEKDGLIFKVTGCGVTAIGVLDTSMLWIIHRIVEKGGAPEITFLGHKDDKEDK